MQNECPLVLIRWEDSRQPVRTWQFLSDIELPETCECVSVGWLLKDEPDRKVVAQSLGGTEDDAQAMGVMVIPTRAVISIERLEEVSDHVSLESSDQDAECSLKPKQTESLSA
jgi:hypothetical protein